MKTVLTVLMSLLVLSPALASEQPYRAETFKQLLASGQPITLLVVAAIVREHKIVPKVARIP